MNDEPKDEAETPEDPEDFWRVFNLTWWYRILEREAGS